ncbi:MAG: sodium-dependent transporter [Oscillospiraceae bacterium]|nr:sodium-dependent transporter [Oscillospiraceae bacterium]
MDNKRGSFSSSLGFVLAAAGSAVGLGNIWRFPYLAARDGGGLFLCVYIVLVLTFGFTLMITEVSIGRRTRQAALTAYRRINKKFGFIGVLASIVPFIILTYYCVIGGWVMKYMVTFISGGGMKAAQDGYFTSFITSPAEPVIYGLVFLAITGYIIYRGINSGIEKISTVLMPVLLIMVVCIAIYSLTLKGSGRTGLEGLAVYVIPDVTGMTFEKIMSVAADAVGQLFYSISVAMGIMVTYGSYFRDEDDLVKSVSRIEMCDTFVAVLAGVMIVPAVYVFGGREAMGAQGPGLMFQVLPKVFMNAGTIGSIVGALFFVMVFFAALTSAMSILETIVSSMIDGLGFTRKKAVIAECVVCAVLSSVICLGYNVFYFELPLPNGSKAQILDIFDYISNYLLMPVVAIATCILIGWVAKPSSVIDEATKNGEKLLRAPMIKVMLKFVAPLMLAALFLDSAGII